jgi:hypothetical protein
MRAVVLGGGDVGMEEGTTQDIGIQGKTKNALTIYLQKSKRHGQGRTIGRRVGWV